jgi:hypothetical protein
MQLPGGSVRQLLARLSPAAARVLFCGAESRASRRSNVAFDRASLTRVTLARPTRAKVTLRSRPEPSATFDRFCKDPATIPI